MNKKLSIFIVSALLAIPIISLAADFKVGEDLFISDRINENLYTAAGRANISGDITGDIVAAGGEITISGAVSQDVFIAGGRVSILGVVSEDARIAGGQIVIHENIGGDLAAAAGEVSVMSNVKIGGDVFVVAGRLIFNGATTGKLSAAAGEIIINGEVAGDVNIKAGKVIVGQDAVIGGDFIYQAQEEAQISEGAQIVGEIKFTQRSAPKVPGFLAPLLLAVSFMGKIILFLVAGLLAVLLFKKFSKNLVERSIANFSRDFIRGLGVFIITPIVLVILLATIIGIPITFIGGLMWILAISISKVYAGIVAGGLLAKWTKKKVIVNWKWATLGIIVIQLIVLIPLLGWLASLVIFLATLGSISYLAHQKFWVNR